MKTPEEKAKELYPDNSIPNSTTVYQEDLENEKCREAFLKGVEFANQQPEVESQTEKILRIAEAARNDPDFERISKEIMEKVESYGIEGPTFSEYLQSIGNPLKSTLTQDKVREAAESAFNQARKQTSMLGEKDVQMTDYLISPKYKTFEDYWNSKSSKPKQIR